MSELYLPVLSHFQNENTWLASIGALRFKVAPGEDTLTAQTWTGPFCYEKSTVEEEKSFPLSDEGIEELRAWLTEKGTAARAGQEKE